MKGKWLSNKQSADLLSIAKTVCNCQFAFINHINDLIDTTTSPCTYTILQQSPLEIVDLKTDARFNESSSLIRIIS